MKVAVVGATGLVGRKMLEVLEERKFPVDELIPVASSRSAGSRLSFAEKSWTVVEPSQGLAAQPDLALFSAGSKVSKEWAPQYAKQGAYVIDNSSAWRMEEGVPLVVPEINGGIVQPSHHLIANPNCSTIQLATVMGPLHRKWRIERLVISTYQSVTGTGKDAVTQYEDEAAGRNGGKVYPHRIFDNCLPHCDVFLENRYTKEEMKLVHETRKILGDETLRITATAVRVPVLGGHSESVNCEFASDVSHDELLECLSNAQGVEVMDQPFQNVYPMPVHAHGKDTVFVGRIRADESQERTFHFWIVADNLRKGAATNAVQIAGLLMNQGIVPVRKRMV